MNPDPHAALKRALVAYLGPLAFGAGKTTHWSSITFEGMQHDIAFTVPWSPRAEDAVAALPDVDLPMAGGFVASIVPVRHVREDDELHVRVEALTITDA